MRDKGRSRLFAAGLTYANVMATVAVFLALGGGAYAAGYLPRDSVGRDQLRRSSVTKAKLAPKSVGRSELRRRSASKSKLAPNSVGPSELRRRGVRKRALSPGILEKLERRAGTGPQGPTGAPGATGPPGPAGPGAEDVRYSAASSATPNPQTVLDFNGLRLRASCDQDGATTALNLSARSTEAATLEETVFSDEGADPSQPTASATVVNLRIPFSAGTDSPFGGPSAGTGYSRVLVDGIMYTASRTLSIHVVIFVDAESDTCSLHGVVVPA